jgi:hypothetical protein
MSLSNQGQQCASSFNSEPASAGLSALCGGLN